MTNDQTQPEWLKKSTADDRGTGIALFMEQGEEKKGSRKQWFTNVTYDEFLGKAKTALAIKWVPDFVGSFETLKAGSCNGAACTKTCVQPGCICDTKAGICQ